MADALKSSKFKVQSSNDSTGSGTKAGKFDLEERTFLLGESVVKFCRNLKTDPVSRPLVSQVVRSATSIGANYSEANNASSRKDYRNKVFIAKKESQETKHWLRLLNTCYPEYRDELRKLWQETHELTLILQSIISKLNESDKNNA